MADRIDNWFRGLKAAEMMYQYRGGLVAMERVLVNMPAHNEHARELRAGMLDYCAHARRLQELWPLEIGA